MPPGAGQWRVSRCDSFSSRRWNWYNRERRLTPPCSSLPDGCRCSLNPRAPPAAGDHPGRDRRDRPPGACRRGRHTNIRQGPPPARVAAGRLRRATSRRSCRRAATAATARRSSRAAWRCTSRTGAMAGGDSGPAIVPGKSAESRLIRYVAGLDEDYQMPPEDAGKPLSPEQVGLLRAWIDQGAKWPGDAAVGRDRRPSDHWSFRPPAPARRRRPSRTRAGPGTRSTRSSWPGSRRRGSTPSPEADRATLDPPRSAST